MVVQLHQTNQPNPESNPSFLTTRRGKMIASGVLAATLALGGGYSALKDSNESVVEIDTDGDGSIDATVILHGDGALSGGEQSGEEPYTPVDAKQEKIDSMPAAFFEKSEVFEEYLEKISTNEPNGQVDVGETHARAFYGYVVSARTHEVTGEKSYAVLTNPLKIFLPNEDGTETIYFAAPDPFTGRFAHVEAGELVGNQITNREATEIGDIDEELGSFGAYRMDGDEDSGQDIAVRPKELSPHTGHYISENTFKRLINGSDISDMASYVTFYDNITDVRFILDGEALDFKEDEDFVYRWELQLLADQS